jgi:acyl-ACP thioesterase
VHRSVVRLEDLDPNGHVNNAAYVDYLEEALLAAGAGVATAAVPRRVRLEYVTAAAPGSRLSGIAWQTTAANGIRAWAWRLVDDDGRELARGELQQPAG